MAWLKFLYNKHKFWLLLPICMTGGAICGFGIAKLIIYLAGL
jgi:hypothetical protein